MSTFLRLKQSGRDQIAIVFPEGRARNPANAVFGFCSPQIVAGPKEHWRPVRCPQGDNVIWNTFRSDDIIPLPSWLIVWVPSPSSSQRGVRYRTLFAILTFVVDPIALVKDNQGSWHLEVYHKDLPGSILVRPYDLILPHLLPHHN